MMHGTSRESNQVNEVSAPIHRRGSSFEQSRNQVFESTYITRALLGFLGEELKNRQFPSRPLALSASRISSPHSPSPGSGLSSLRLRRREEGRGHVARRRPARGRCRRSAWLLRVRLHTSCLDMSWTCLWIGPWLASSALECIGPRPSLAHLSATSRRELALERLAAQDAPADTSPHVSWACPGHVRRSPCRGGRAASRPPTPR